MKAIKSLLVFGCVAALVACSKEKEPGAILLKAGQHSITLSVDERPDTRVSYSHQEGESVYRFSWSSEDAIGVYVPGREEAVLYSIDEIKKLYKLWGYDLTDTDIENYNNIDYIFWKTCIEPEKKIYESVDYDILLHSFIKED